MHWFAEELKKAREAKNITLLTVASATNISLPTLNALESGDYFLLPHVYMRAFVKEYASCIGLDAAETVQRFDRAIEELQRQRDAERSAAAQAGERVTLSRMLRRMVSHIQSWMTENIPQVIITSLGVLVLIVVSWLFLHSSHRDTVTAPVREVPFQQVLRESEEAAATTKKSAFALSLRDQGFNASVDSLVLRATTTDSVWMSIVVDDKDTTEYLFGPLESKTWKAQEQFSITLGNAGGMTFTLNDQTIGSLGKPGAVVRDVQLTWRELTHPE